MIQDEMNKNQDINNQSIVAIQGSRAIKELDELKRLIRRLLEVDNVGVLLGSGVSLDAGGKTMIDIAQEILPAMEQCFSDVKFFWEKLITLCTKRKDSDPYIDIEQLATYLTSLEHLSDLEDSNHSILFSKDKSSGNIAKSDIKKALKIYRNKIFELCSLPTTGKESALETYILFLKKLLAHRRSNQSRLSIFTTNYDLLVEQSCDDLGITYINGFHGIENRKFRPEVFDLDLHRVEVGEKHKYHFYDKVVHLFKLHGSLTWAAEDDPLNPFLISEKPYALVKSNVDKDTLLPLIIYPTSAKYGEATGFPYSEMFRRMSSFLTRSQTVLFTIGYGFNDTHVNAVIRQGLSQPTLTLIAFLRELKTKGDEEFHIDINDKSHFTNLILNTYDNRIILVGSENAKWNFIVNNILPDVDEEDPLDQIRKTLDITGKS